MSDPFRNRIAGVIRFSYPASGGFRLTPGDPAAARALLYDPDRLARRFALFQALTLPSLLAQTDRDFDLVVLIGTDLPATWRDRLEGLIAPLPGARVLALPPGQPSTPAANAAFRSILDRVDTDWLTSFRLDDDDALDRDFIARLRRLAGMLGPAAQGRPFAIGHGHGFWLELSPDGNRIFDVRERSAAVGAALVAPAVNGQTIYSRNHRALAERFDTWLDAGTPAFIRTVHRDNDANPHVQGQRDTLPPDRVAALLERHFPLAATDLMRLRP